MSLSLIEQLQAQKIKENINNGNTCNKLIMGQQYFLLIYKISRMIRSQSNEKSHRSLSKLLDQEYMQQSNLKHYESKQSTSEQFYDQIFKHKIELRRRNHQLKRQIQQTKQLICSQSLGLYFLQLKQLNQNNIKLREQHRLVYEAKKPSIFVQPTPPKSPLHTPRSRRSVVQISNNINQKIRCSRPEENDIYVGRKSLNIQNIQNIKPHSTVIHGRNSLKLSMMPKRNHEQQQQQQLTQRKMQNSNYFSANISSMSNNNISNFSQTNSMRSSLKSRNGNTKTTQQQNIFSKFIRIMLEEEKQQQKQIVQFVDEQKMLHRGHQQNHIDRLESEVTKTYSNIQKLQGMLQNYESQMKKIQLNLNYVTDMVKQISKLKQSYVVMQQKCKNVQLLRIQISTKQKRLKQIKQSNKMQQFQIPQSIKMMLRLFGIQQESILNPSKCKNQLKNLVKGSFQKPSKKKIKLKQLFDNVKQNRKKFKQLMSLYEGRIKKLQRKLASIKNA